VIAIKQHPPEKNNFQTLLKKSSSASQVSPGREGADGVYLVLANEYRVLRT